MGLRKDLKNALEAIEILKEINSNQKEIIARQKEINENQNEIIDRQNKVIEELTKKLEEIEEKIKEREIPSFVKEDVNHRHEKTGQKEGHEGYSRHIPERTDKVKELNLNECPRCGGHNLSDVQEIRERYVTDIPEPQEPIVTKYKIPRKYCRDCKTLVEPTVTDALPNARFGLRLMLYVLFLKIGMAMPIEKILELVKNQYKLDLSNGEVVCILEQLSREFGPYYKELKQKIIEAKSRHIDETGRRIAGENHWMWVFITKEVAFYAVRKGRGHEVPLKILGKNCGGVNITDRLSAYYVLQEKTDCVMQVCWVHILRESKKLEEDFEEGKIVHKRLKSIYKKACSFDHKGTEKDVEKLIKRIENIRKIKFTSTKCDKFIKRLSIKDRENLFRFVVDPEVESTNNRAERGLRPDVVIRKISGGNRSKEGAKIHECLLSVMQTYRLQNKNLLTEGLSYLQNQLQTAK